MLPQKPLPPWLARLLGRFPSLQRHPHPMVAHFAIVFCLAATFFTLLYLATGRKVFEQSAFHFLAGVVVSTPAAILTGLFTQWLNFGEPGKEARLETKLSLLLLALALIACAWRISNPEVLEDLAGVNIVYLLLVISLTPVVSVISYFGGMLTFPLEEEGDGQEK
jgi:uncharacterized membrane protein